MNDNARRTRLPRYLPVLDDDVLPHDFGHAQVTDGVGRGLDSISSGRSQDSLLTPITSVTRYTLSAMSTSSIKHPRGVPLTGSRGDVVEFGTTSAFAMEDALTRYRRGMGLRMV